MPPEQIGPIPATFRTQDVTVVPPTVVSSTPDPVEFGGLLPGATVLLTLTVDNPNDFPLYALDAAFTPDDASLASLITFAGFVGGETLGAAGQDILRLNFFVDPSTPLGTEVTGSIVIDVDRELPPEE